MIWDFFPNDFHRLNANNFYSFCLLGTLWSSLMNPDHPPPYPGPGPTAPYPPYPPQPMGPMAGPYPPPQGYPYPGYPQYGWQGGPQEPPKTTGGWLWMCGVHVCSATSPKEMIAYFLCQRRNWSLWLVVHVWWWWLKVLLTQEAQLSSSLMSLVHSRADDFWPTCSQGHLLEHWLGEIQSCFCCSQFCFLV